MRNRKAFSMRGAALVGQAFAVKGLWKLRIALVPLLLSPYVVAFSHNLDSSYTTLEFAAGSGSYAGDLTFYFSTYSTTTSVTMVPFQDGGISLDHYFSSFRVGAKAGIVHNVQHQIFEGKEGNSAIYLNPNVGLNTKYFGLDVGGLFGPVSRFYSSGWAWVPTGALRFGKLHGTYVSFSLHNNLPLITGGGLFDLGIGFKLGPQNSRLWLGICGGPYRNAASLGLLGIHVAGWGPFSIKGDVPVSDKLLLNVRGQVGSTEGQLEYGLSSGIRVIF